MIPASSSDDLPQPDGPAIVVIVPGRSRDVHGFDVGVASEERLRVVRTERHQPRVGARDALARGGSGESSSGIVTQDRRLELGDARAGLDAELLVESRPRGAQHGEGVGLAVGAIVRQREDRPAVLAQRGLPHALLGFGDHGAVLAGAQARVEQLLLGARVQLDEPRGFGGAGLPRRDLRQRGAPPQCERLAVDVDRPVVLAVQGVLARRGDQPLEPHGVDRLGVDRQAVLPADRLDGLSSESRPDARDRVAHLLLPGRGRLLAPERIGELCRRDALAAPDDERREDHPLARAERVGARVERAEHHQRHASRCRFERGLFMTEVWAHLGPPSISAVARRISDGYARVCPRICRLATLDSSARSTRRPGTAPGSTSWTHFRITDDHPPGSRRGRAHRRTRADRLPDGRRRHRGPTPAAHRFDEGAAGRRPGSTPAGRPIASPRRSSATRTACARCRSDSPAFRPTASWSSSSAKPPRQAQH